MRRPGEDLAPNAEFPVVLDYSLFAETGASLTYGIDALGQMIE